METVTTFEIKPLSKEAIPDAIKKAEHYRLLNDPSPAESICLDVLEVEPDNQHVLIVLLLALTDQFDRRLSEGVRRANEVLSRLRDEYSRAYYGGLIFERQANVQLRRGDPGSGSKAYESYRKAMECYEEAEKIRPPENDDAILRWNACARIIMRHRELKPAPDDTFQTWLE